MAGVDVLSGKMDTQSLLDAALPTAPPPEFGTMLVCGCCAKLTGHLVWITDERFPDRKRYTMKVIDEEGQESEVSYGVLSLQEQDLHSVQSLGVDQQQRDRERELRHHYEVKLAQVCSYASGSDVCLNFVSGALSYSFLLHAAP